MSSSSVSVSRALSTEDYWPMLRKKAFAYTLVVAACLVGAMLLFDVCVCTYQTVGTRTEASALIEKYCEAPGSTMKDRSSTYCQNAYAQHRHALAVAFGVCVATRIRSHFDACSPGDTLCEVRRQQAYDDARLRQFAVSVLVITILILCGLRWAVGMLSSSSDILRRITRGRTRALGGIIGSDDNVDREVADEISAQLAQKRHQRAIAAQAAHPQPMVEVMEEDEEEEENLVRVGKKWR